MFLKKCFYKKMLFATNGSIVGFFSGGLIQVILKDKIRSLEDIKKITIGKLFNTSAYFFAASGFVLGYKCKPIMKMLLNKKN
jgi:hypothetical protein